jgi:hypothetical protein
VTRRQALDRWLEDTESEVLLANGFDDALVGVAQVFNRLIAIYDRAECLKILESQGMDPDEAEEYFEFNTQGAYVGEGTPGYLVWKG